MLLLLPAAGVAGPFPLVADFLHYNALHAVFPSGNVHIQHYAVGREFLFSQDLETLRICRLAPPIFGDLLRCFSFE